MAKNHKEIKANRTQGRDEATESDPVLAMLGVGRQLWETESGDRFVERLRSEDLPVPPAQSFAAPLESLPEAVWRRLVDNQGSLFETVRGLPFTFKVEGTG